MADDEHLVLYPARVSSDTHVDYTWECAVPTLEDNPKSWAELSDYPTLMDYDDYDFEDVLPSRVVIKLDEEEVPQEKEKDLNMSQSFMDAREDAIPARATAPPGVWVQQNLPTLPTLQRLRPQQNQMPPGTWDNAQNSVSKAEGQCTSQQAVVEHTPVGTSDALDCPLEGKTTVVIRNFPHTYTRDNVCELLNLNGFDGCYDFVYLPVDFLSWMAFGFAFVNMKTHEDALRVMDVMEGFSDWGASGGTECDVVWSAPYQGLKANIERYRNSSIMAPSVLEMYKPLLILDGKVAAFPAPTKKLNPPRVRKSSQYSNIRARIESM